MKELCRRSLINYQVAWKKYEEYLCESQDNKDNPLTVKGFYAWMYHTKTNRERNYTQKSIQSYCRYVIAQLKKQSPTINYMDIPLMLCEDRRKIKKIDNLVLDTLCTGIESDEDKDLLYQVLVNHRLPKEIAKMYGVLECTISQRYRRILERAGLYTGNKDTDYWPCDFTRPVYYSDLSIKTKLDIKVNN